MASMTIYPSRDRWLWMGFRGDTEPTEVDAFRYGQFLKFLTLPRHYVTRPPIRGGHRKEVSSCPLRVIGHAHAGNRNILQRDGEKPNK